MHLILVIIKFSIVLGIMVFIHELGHFIVGKLCGVRVETFSIGFGTRLFGFIRGGTDYRISLLPLGGYVKFAGEYGIDPAKAAPDELPAKPRWQRVLIALAGPVANFILAFFLLTLVSHYHHEVDKYLSGPAVVDYVPVNTPSARAGLVPGDTITSFNKIADPTWDQILKECALNLNRTLPMTYEHEGKSVSRDFSASTGDSSGELGPETMTAIGLVPREQTGPIGVSTISGGTPADRAGLKPGDLIERIDDLYPHSVNTLHIYLRDRSGAPSVLTVLRGGKPLTIALTPERVESAPSYAQYQIGFLPVLPPAVVERLPLGQAMAQSVKDNRDDSTLILRVLQGMFTRHVSVKSLSGPVGIAQQIDLATQNEFPWTLYRLMATISLNLGIFNLLPFPPLDGGMIFFLLIESVLRRDVNQGIKDRIYQVAFVAVICLAVFVMYNDIVRLRLGH